MAKIIIITGATRGLGRALAEEFIHLGHTILGCGRTEAKLAELSSRYGQPHRFDCVDVANLRTVELWAKDILGNYPPPDFLLNNAGLINRNAPMWLVPPDEFSNLIDVNIKGIYHVIKSFLPAMNLTGRGVIANFSSGWGNTTSPGVAPYCASKWAVEALSRALAQELPHGVACVTLNPGIIDTDMLRICYGGRANEYIKPEKWAKKAAPFILNLGSRDNGKVVTIQQ